MDQKIFGLTILAATLLPLGCANEPQDIDDLLLRPWGVPTQTPADLGLAYEEVSIPSANGKLLNAWFMPAQGTTAKATMLVHTGMEGNIGRYTAFLGDAATNSFNILIYDWQGFGASEGTPSFDNFEPDSRAAVDYLKARPEASCRKIIHVGVSLGTLPAVAIATETTDETIGLVLYGPFFPDELPWIWIAEEVNPLLAPLGSVMGGLWFTVLPQFLRPQDYIASLQVPILVITPSDDATVPPKMQADFYDALPSPKARYLTFGGHVHAPEVDPGLTEAVITWANQLP